MEADGSFYTETVVPVSDATHGNWAKAYKFSQSVRDMYWPFENRQGASSLVEIAAREAARQMNNLRADHLIDVPDCLVQKIWGQIIKGRLESFHAWRVVASASSPETLGSSSFRYHFQNFERPLRPLTYYVQEMRADLAQWLVCLRVNVNQASQPDLITLGTIPNLAVLELSFCTFFTNSMDGIGERIFKSWVEMIHAENSTAFQSLRVLVFRGFPCLDKWMFPYLAVFPSLCHVIVTDCDLISQVNRKSWSIKAQASGFEGWDSLCSRDALKAAFKDGSPFLRLPSGDFSLATISSFYYMNKDTGTSAVDTRPDSRVPGYRPMAGFEIAEPHPWKIDYPRGAYWKGRTVVFENKRATSRKNAEDGKVAADAANDPCHEQPKRTRITDHSREVREATALDHIYITSTLATNSNTDSPTNRGTTVDPSKTGPDNLHDPIYDAEHNDLDPTTSNSPNPRPAKRRRVPGPARMRDLSGLLAEMGGVAGSRTDRGAKS